MTTSGIVLVRRPERTNQWLVTTAIGGEYFGRWEESAKVYWELYARKHDYGIAVVTNALNHEDEPDRDGAWQKLLAPRALRLMLGHDVRCALWDTDLIPSPVAPAIFDAVPIGQIGVVSQEHELPGDADVLRKRIAFMRNRHLDPDFPLWSSLNGTPSQRFQWAGLPRYADMFCSGMFVIDTESHAELLATWFRDAPESPEYKSFGSEELWLNVKAQESELCVWLPYEWQALWIFEVAANYPFLYSTNVTPEVATWCFASTLMRNHIVHLAGRWESSLLLGHGPAFPGEQNLVSLMEALSAHEQSAREAIPRGKIQPSRATKSERS